jgi:Mg2+-importing ATPase
MPSTIQIPASWSTLDIPSLLSKLKTRETGLSVDETHMRLKQFGLNELAKRESTSLFRRMLGKLKNPLIILLLLAGLLSALAGQVSDFIIILVITVISVALDTFQEHSAELAAEKLKKSVALTATVVHGTEKKEVQFSHVVTGDIVFLSTGDIVPADGRLLTSEHLMIDQSTLTGESYPQHKRFDESSDRVNCVFMGTQVVSGEGLMVVVTTSGATELGKIASSLVGGRGKTDFEKGLTQYGLLLIKFVALLAPVVFIAHMASATHPMLESVLFVLALAVGFAPELLPLIVTINLSKGALRMSKKGVIVKYLPAIENLGSMDVLCTDKTGTLTENAITLMKYENIRGETDPLVLKYGFLASHFQSSMDNPIEVAIRKKGSRIHDVTKYKKIFELPFDFYRKRMSVILMIGQKTILITKGAPELLLSQCTGLDDKVKKSIKQRLSTLESQGFRVIAVAMKDVTREKKYHTSVESGLTLVGFMAFLDPPKLSAKSSLALLEKAGIAIKILTGDSELVTVHVCEELSLPVTGILLGNDIERLDDAALVRAVDGITIFARLNPESKKRVIDAVRSNGHVVGYLGDGVNDAPSLRAGDIGISVNNATDVAKESADLILLHKDLHVLHEGVIEGRKTFSNVMKYIKMGTSSNFGNMVSVAIASIFLPFLPMLPTQILLNDLLYDFSQLFLASDSVDAAVLRKPRKWNIAGVKHFMMVFGPISSLFDVITFIILLKFFKATPTLFQTGWFLESLITQTLIIFSIRTTIVPFFRSRISPRFAFGLYGVVLLSILLPLSPLAGVFNFVAPPTVFYSLLGLLILCYFVLVETAKLWFYKRFDL